MDDTQRFGADPGEKLSDEANAPRRRPIIGVMGSGRDAYDELASPLGRWIAEQRFHLLTGAGGGVMASVSKAFVGVQPREGLAIGVTPGLMDRRGRCRTPEGYPNPYIELPIRTHLALSGRHGAEVGSRNHINVLSADVVVVLPGGEGTRSELMLASRYDRPTILFLGSHRASLLHDADANATVARSLDEVAALVSQVLKSKGV